MDLASGLGVTELGLTNYTTAMRYSRPQTTTLQYADGTTAPLAWQNTSQDQRQPLRRPATGRIRLIVDTVWGNGSQAQQPLGVAEIIPFADSARLGLSTAATRITPGSAATPTTAPPLSGPTSTSPATLPVTTTATGPSNALGGTDPWRWWLVGVMVILAGFFLVRGLRRQRRR